MIVVELRCEENPRRLFAKMLMKERPQIVEGNLLEFACRDCQNQFDKTRVLHRFDIEGTLVETEMV